MQNFLMLKDGGVFKKRLEGGGRKLTDEAPRRKIVE